MRKRYLLKYELPEFFALKDWIDVKLTIEIVWLWGIFKTHKIVKYRLYDYMDFKSHFDLWDSLIKDKLIIKKL